MTLEHHAGLDVNVMRIGDAPARLQMLHCTMARGDALLRLHKALGQPQGTVMFDLPNHGQTADAPEGADVHALTTAIGRDLLEGPTHVIGHSFGATVALRMALEDDRVTRLTLIEPVLFAAAAGMPGYLQHGEDFRPVDDAFNAGDPEAAARAFLGIWGLPMPWDALPARARAEALRTIDYVRVSEHALHHDSSGMLAPGRLESLTIPVTLISGSDTHPVMAEIDSAFCARLPNARSVTIKGAGHMAPITHPEQVAAAIGPLD